MAGAMHRNSSSGRNERHEKNEERDAAGQKKPLPANIRVAHREDAQPFPHFAPGHTLSMPHDQSKSKADTKRTEQQQGESASNSSLFAKATKHAEKLTADAAAEKKSSSRPQRQVSNKQDIDNARCWQVKLTPSTLLTITILLLVTLGFFFLFGLIVGRGSVPPAQAPVLERLNPQTSSSPEHPEQILTEENLRFMTNLKSDAPPSAEVGNVSQAVDSKASGTAKKGAEGKPDTTGKKEASEIKTDTTKYDFVVRAAAFKSENQADDLRARLEGNGIRTRLVREKAQKGTWYHVQILYRGTEAGVEELRTNLKKYAIKDTIIASKKAVE